MEQKNLWNKNFTILVIGQLISLFGNAILRFALPLYLLDITESATIFGLVLAFSVIPMIILSPIGGIIADRANKRNVMVILDFGTSLLAFIIFILLGRVEAIPLIFSAMIILFAIQGAYQPTVQSSVPALQKIDNLLPANAIVNQVNSLSGLLGPVTGGILYAYWGLTPILIISGISFFISAILGLFIKIPYYKLPFEKNILILVKKDFSESIQFIKKEKPIILKTMYIVATFNLFLTSMILIGTPVLVTQTLGLSSQFLGYAQGALMAGGVFGGIMVGILRNRIKIQKAYILLFGASLTMVPIGFTFFINLSDIWSYTVLIVCVFLFMMISTIFSIQMLTFIQGETPQHLIGKVISCVLMLSLCAQPIGNALYGILFDVFENTVWIVIFIALLSALIISFISKNVFTKIKI